MKGWRHFLPTDYHVIFQHDHYPEPILLVNSSGVERHYNHKTTALIFLPDQSPKKDSAIAIGHSYCSITEVGWNRRRGNVIAKGRAEKSLAEQIALSERSLPNGTFFLKEKTHD